MMRRAYFLSAVALLALLLSMACTESLLFARVAHEEMPGMPSPAQSPAPLSGPVPGSPEDIAYSEYMHRLNGVFVLLLGILALLEQKVSGRGLILRWGFPALFLLAGVYLVVRSDPDGWPMGEKGLLESLQDPVIVQHKIAAGILLLIGFSELLSRAGWDSAFLGQVFPVAAISAGFLLFLHAGANHHQGHKVYAQHLIMGGTAIAIGTARALAERLRIGLAVWMILTLVLGVELLVYTE